MAGMELVELDDIVNDGLERVKGGFVVLGLCMVSKLSPVDVN